MTERTKPQSREEQAGSEIGQTQVSRGVKWTPSSGCSLAAVPVAETYRTRGSTQIAGMDFHGRSVATSSTPCSWAVAAYNEHRGGWTPEDAARQRAVLLQSIDQYEEGPGGRVAAAVRAAAGPELLVHAGSGNERAYIGRWRWLFYRLASTIAPVPDSRTCGTWPTGPAAVPNGVRPRSPTPRAAILQFHQQLCALETSGVAPAPTPDKATIHPEKFSSAMKTGGWEFANPSYRQLLDEPRPKTCRSATTGRAGGVSRSIRRHGLPGHRHALATRGDKLAAAELARLIEEEIVFDTKRCGSHCIGRPGGRQESRRHRDGQPPGAVRQPERVRRGGCHDPPGD